MLIGKIDSGSFIKVIAEIPLKFTVTFKDGDTVLQQVEVKKGRTATYNGTVPPKGSDNFAGWVFTKPQNSIIDTDVFSETIYQQIPNVQSDLTCWAVYENHLIIRDSWEVISQRSLAGTAQNYYTSGNLKRVHVEGTIGTVDINQDFYVRFLGAYDGIHDGMQGGIYFQCFTDISTRKAVGITKFSMNHQPSNLIVGGWSGCDLRYDVLGSTDVAPSGYGSAVTESRTGYSATSTCATNPVQNTLMSCLPSDLRAVMRPIEMRTDIGKKRQINVTTDYLPLLIAKQVSLQNTWYNNSETQPQLDYNADEGKRYDYKDTSKAVGWWLCSPSYFQINSDNTYPYYFCVVGSNGYIGQEPSSYNLAIAPIFLV